MWEIVGPNGVWYVNGDAAFREVINQVRQGGHWVRGDDASIILARSGKPRPKRST